MKSCIRLSYDEAAKIDRLKPFIKKMEQPIEKQKPVKFTRNKPHRVNRILINPFRISVDTNETDKFIKDLEKLIDTYGYNNEYNYGWQVEETVKI